MSAANHWSSWISVCRYLLLALAALAFVPLVPAQDTWESDFVTPSGADPGPAGYGPWNSRLLVAWSRDGLVWMRTGWLVSDQADVPDLVQDPSGRIFLYYTGWTVGDERNRTCVASSTDGGRTWAYKRVVLDGFDGMSSPVDPDIQRLADGTFRLYVTSDPHDGNGPRTYLAEGRDGIHFGKRGVAFHVPGEQVLDPSTVKIGDVWHIFAGGSTPSPDSNWHGTSRDGKQFVFDREAVLQACGMRQAAANAISIPGGYRLYTFSHETSPQICSFVTKDGASWVPDAGVRLVLDSATGQEAVGVKDPAVVRRSDGIYLMVYSTVIP
ncbi:MAG: hypothetical protein HY720_28775 [Planctomycetes bacterium]|nr:hypothetical protein [Planctomycetota bacterium]